MFLSDKTMKLLVESGMPADKLVELLCSLRDDEAASQPTRSRGAERQARYRERNKASLSVTEHNEASPSVTRDDGAFLSPSLPPTPPNPTTNLSPVPPIVPQAGQKSSPAKPLSTDLAEQIWQLANQPSRGRSGRPALRKAVTAAQRQGATPDALRASVSTHCAGAGDHAKGVHRIIEGEHWREHLPRPEPPATAEERAWRLEHFRATREWKPSWGERPKDAA